ncbi:uncharacterized protein LOC107845492 isoform X4 [Capsicum annuum]|nr:uncharacterized protein LOC107845492 isoform X4 [Capsicum annuum]XP_047254506.1 uncharacterized protein LOC107845492 isoform X4 [Capsicum annuum]XP_047254507.1 uncharacterized protein LOC107845492 isoform X4 [Capsicum annuum]
MEGQGPCKLTCIWILRLSKCYRGSDMTSFLEFDTDLDPRKRKLFQDLALLMWNSIGIIAAPLQQSFQGNILMSFLLVLLRNSNGPRMTKYFCVISCWGGSGN